MSCGSSYYKAMMASLWAGALFYGAYSVLFGICISIFVYQSFNRKLLVVAIAMFTLATAQTLVLFAQYLTTYEVVTETECVGFTCHACYDRDTLRYEELDIWNRLQPVSQALLVTNQLIADSLLLYRCFGVWQHKYMIIIIPFLMMAVTAGTVISYPRVFQIDINIYPSLYLIRLRTPLDQQTPPTDWSHLQSLQCTLSETYMATSLATNVVVTTLIASRIWWKSRQVRDILGSQGGKTRSAVTIVIESGAIYSASLLVWIIIHVILPNTFDTIAGAISAQLVGIVPTLIIVRVGLCRNRSKAGGSASPPFVEFELGSPTMPTSRTAWSNRQSMYGADLERQPFPPLPLPVPVIKSQHLSLSTVKLSVPETPARVRKTSTYN